MERELDSIRTLRSMDLPAFQQAQKQAHLSAAKASERVARTRTMGRMGNEVREALFGGEFEQYVGSRLQGFERHAALTQQLFQGTEAIQKMVMDAEMGASAVSYKGQAAGAQDRG